MHLNSERALVIEIKVSKLSANSIFLLAIVIDNKVAKTKTSFLTILDTKLNNNSFCYSCNIFSYSNLYSKSFNSSFSSILGL